MGKQDSLTAARRKSTFALHEMYVSVSEVDHDDGVCARIQHMHFSVNCTPKKMAKYGTTRGERFTSENGKKGVKLKWMCLFLVCIGLLVIEHTHSQPVIILCIDGTCVCHICFDFR